MLDMKSSIVLIVPLCVHTHFDKPLIEGTRMLNTGIVCSAQLGPHYSMDISITASQLDINMLFLHFHFGLSFSLMQCPVKWLDLICKEDMILQKLFIMCTSRMLLKENNWFAFCLPCSYFCLFFLSLHHVSTLTHNIHIVTFLLQFGIKIWRNKGH